MIGHDLEKPMMARSGRKPGRPPRYDVSMIAALAVGASLALIGFWALLVKDPLGGEPVATAVIQRHVVHSAAATPEAVTAGHAVVLAAVSSRNGVPVVRPGDPLPKSGPVIIRLPGGEGAAEDAFAPAKEAQTAMLEDSAYGLLPRVAPDGRRPLDVYGRPSEGAAGAPRVALIVAGLGVSRDATLSAIQSLPGAVTFAFSPYGQDVADLVAKARGAGHEVLIQAPMEPFGYPSNDTGPQTLLTALPASANLERLRWALGRAKGYVGVAPLGGGKFLEAEASLSPVFIELARRGLMFVAASAGDDGHFSEVAERAGLTHAKPATAIDIVADPAAIDAALAGLERAAKQGQVAVGWANASPLGLKRIDVWLAGLADRGVTLAPASAAVGPQGPS
ncbi:MAG TPA: divergent polysaccharide deacetylase family protein [Hansschlegelia sp.]